MPRQMMWPISIKSFADAPSQPALELIDLADNTRDLDEASDLLPLAAEQLELAAREDAPQQQQQQVQPKKG
jgi:hypothetical protein